MSDLVLWHRWQTQAASLTPAAFLSLLCRYYHNPYRRRFLRAVREKSLLQPAPAAATILAGFALATERAILTRQRQINEQNWFDFQKTNRNHTWSTRLRQLKKTRQNLRQGQLPLKGYRLQNPLAAAGPDTLAGATTEQAAEIWASLHRMDEEPVLWILGSEFLDELYRLLAQVEMRQQAR